MADLGRETVQLRWQATGAMLSDRDVTVWCAYTGQKQEELQAWGWLKALHPDDQEQVARLWSQSLERGRFFETSCRILHTDDHFYMFHVKWVPVMNGEKRIETWVGWFTPYTAASQLSDQSALYNHALFQLLLEQASIGMTCRTLDGYFLQVNEQFTRIVGYSLEELRNMTVLDLSIPEDREPYAAFLQSMLLEKVSINAVENRGVRKDGIPYWVKVTTTLLRLPSGEPHIFLSIMEDITEGKKIEAERARLLADEQRLRAEAIKRENKLKAIFKSMTEYVVVYDLEGNLVHANDAALQLLHINPGEALSLIQYIRGFVIRDAHGKRLDLEQTLMSRTLRGEVLPNAQAEDIVVSAPSAPPVSLSVTAAPIFDYNGKICGGVSVFRDVTVQREKEHRILQALQALILLVETLVQVPAQAGENQSGNTIPLVRSMTDMGEQLAEHIAQILQCRYVSIISFEPVTERMRMIGAWGLQPEKKEKALQEAQTSTLADYLDEASIGRLRADKVVIRDLIRQPLKNRSSFELPHLMVAPMFLDTRLVGILAIGKPESEPHYTEEDIAITKAVAKLTVLVIERTRLLSSWAETRANEQALLEANRHFEAFLSIAGHELKTPLTAMKGNIHLALRRLETWKQHKDEQGKDLQMHIERIQQPLERAIQRAILQDRLVGELLDASQMQTKQLDLQYDYCNLTELVNITIKQIQQEEPDHTFIYSTSPAMPLITLVNRERIQQVIRTYLLNAARRSTPEQPIIICLQKERQTIRFSTSDTGEKIAAEHREHVWEPFYTAKQITVRYYGALEDLGAGLYICRKIIEYHKGHTGISTTRKGDTSFWFTLPLLAMTTETETTSNATEYMADEYVCE